MNYPSNVRIIRNSYRWKLQVADNNNNYTTDMNTNANNLYRAVIMYSAIVG